MSEKDGKKKYGAQPADTPASEEDYSLEEILAEFGGGLEQKLMREAGQAAEPPGAKETPPASEQEQPVPEEAASSPEKEQAVSETAFPAPEKQEAPAEKPEPPACPKAASAPETVQPPAAESAPAAAKEGTPTPEPQPVPEAPPGVLQAPKPIPLETVVGSTVDAVLDELIAPPLKQPKRGLFSRRKLEETEQLYDDPALPEPDPGIESIGPEPALYEAEDEAWQKFRAGKGMLPPALLFALAASAPPAAERYGVVIPYWTGDHRFQSIILLACLLIMALLCRQVFVKGFVMLARKRCVGELLVSLSALAAMADCAVCLLVSERTAAAPYGAVACLALFFAQWGVNRENRGMYDTFRAASMDDAPPYLVTDTERGACKQRGAVPGFYSAAVADNAAVIWQTALLPLVLAGSIVFAGLTSLGEGRKADFALNLSAILAAGATFSLPLCWGLPWARLARHLQKTGCAVAGWSGAEKISRRRYMIVSDTDLFPPGTIQLNGTKVYGEERRKVAAYAATMARRANCGLERLFDGILRGEGARYETVDDFSFYEEGGWSGAIHGESVLMGTASFMRKMDVRLPGDINLKTGVFLAVDRQLIAVFAVKYNPAENVDFALRMMRRTRVTAILAARDPNITPALLKRKFHKGVRVEYPDLTSRVALSEAERDRDLPRALLFREGLLPYAETVVGSRRLCQAVRRSVLISLLGGIVGALLAFYLLLQGAYDLLTPLALEVFLLLWTLPVLLISDWSGRY